MNCSPTLTLRPHLPPERSSQLDVAYSCSWYNPAQGQNAQKIAKGMKHAQNAAIQSLGNDEPQRSSKHLKGLRNALVGRRLDPFGSFWHRREKNRPETGPSVFFNGKKMASVTLGQRQLMVMMIMLMVTLMRQVFGRYGRRQESIPNA